MKASVAIAVLLALTSLAIAVLSLASVKSLELQVAKCAQVGDPGVRETRTLGGNLSLKEQITEIKGVINEVISNTSATHLDIRKIIKII